MTLKKVLAKFKKKYIKYRGVILPPKQLRFGGKVFSSNYDFLGSAKEEANRLIKHFGLSYTSSLLEIGCGPGRLAIGIIQELGKIERYEAIDVHQPSIEWCNRFIHTQHPTFNFKYVNFYNERYNPLGVNKISIPFGDQSFDIIYLFSVFTHLDLDDVISYLKEFNRVLKPNGNIFLTAFLENNVPEITINPDNYIRKWNGALHCVRYNKSFFLDTLKEHGFRIDNITFEAEKDLQTGIYLSLGI